MEGLGDGYEAFVERMQMDIAASNNSKPPAPPPSHPYNQRFAGYPPSANNAFTVKRETDSAGGVGVGGGDISMHIADSTPTPTAAPASSSFSSDVNKMPDVPTRRSTHRRAQSESAFRLPDDLFEPEFGGGSDFPSMSDELGDDLLAICFDAEQQQHHQHPHHMGGTSSNAVGNCSSGGSSSNDLSALGSFSAKASENAPPSYHSRSSSMDGGMLAGSFSSSSQMGGKGVGTNTSTMDVPPRPRHQHSYSMDGSTSFSHDLLYGNSESAESKKAMAAKKLAEIALVDPKRAKRILANRQSAARSKERKTRYISELERKVQTLQTEATTLSAQLSLLQRDTTGLTSENSELRVRLQAFEQQAQLRDALNEALKEEIQRLRLASVQLSASNDQAFNTQHLPPMKQFAGSQYTSQHLPNQYTPPQPYSQSDLPPSSNPFQGKPGTFGNPPEGSAGGNQNNGSHSQPH